MNTSRDLRHHAHHGNPLYTAADAESRLDCLRRAGFDEVEADKVFLAVDLPSIEKIEQKIGALKSLGFENPVKMITSLPAILGYAIDNIRGKLDYAGHFGIDGRGIVERFPPLLGYNLDRIRLCVRLSLPLIDPWEMSLSFLITRDPATSVAAALLSRPETLKALRAAMRLRAGRPGENHDVIARHPGDKLTLAYRRYRPVAPREKAR
ncbi:MAG: hypothetical protein A3E78_03260 [Alphaproteobacteria bacterium RIFCSPHIGHO2_12_FULL_63_12]|nr:MAG: hypothetical protein A3E78_03260 [Alphaproteobacteria bacterium RIFCSPHIGHO2_12_FULL_63_12]